MVSDSLFDDIFSFIHFQTMIFIFLNLEEVFTETRIFNFYLFLGKVRLYCSSRETIISPTFFHNSDTTLQFLKIVTKFSKINLS